MWCRKILRKLYQHGFATHGRRVLSTQSQEQGFCPHTLLQDYFIPAHEGYTQTYAGICKNTQYNFHRSRNREAELSVNKGVEDGVSNCDKCRMLHVLPL